MAKIHMETENVRTIAHLLDQKAGDLDESVERLKRARSRLSNTWSGGSREKRFMSQYNSLLKQMNAKAHELQALSMRVYREVDEWERVDSGFGVTLRSHSGFTGGFPGILPFSPGGIYLPGGLFIPGMFLGPGMLLLPGIGVIAGTVLTGMTLGDLVFDNLPWLETGMMLNLDGDLAKWSSKDGMKDFDPKLGVGIKSGIEDSVVHAEARDQGNIGYSYGEVDLVRGELGVKAGLDEDGFAAGVYAEYDSFKSSGTAVLGSSLFGLTVGGTVAAGSASGELGVYAGEEGVGAEAKIGASAVSGEVELGMNVAGKNVGISAGASVGFELGVKIGTETEISLGPVKVGISFGSAK